MSDGEGTDARLARCLELVREIAADNLADYVADIASPRGSAAPSAPPSVPASRSASPPPGFPVTTGQIEVRWLRRDSRALPSPRTHLPLPPDYVALTSSCRQIALHSRPLAPWFCDFRLLAGARLPGRHGSAGGALCPGVYGLCTTANAAAAARDKTHARQPPKPWMRIGSTTELMEASTAAPGATRDCAHAWTSCRRQCAEGAEPPPSRSQRVGGAVSADLGDSAPFLNRRSEVAARLTAGGADGQHHETQQPPPPASPQPSQPSQPQQPQQSQPPHRPFLPVSSSRAHLRTRMTTCSAAT